MSITYYAGDRLTALSSDSLPLNIADGAFCICTDTLTQWLKVSGVWVKIGGGWTQILKTSDQSISNNTTTALDSQLYFPMLNGHVYSVRGILYFSAGAGGVKWGMEGPTATVILEQDDTPSSSANPSWGAPVTSLPTANEAGGAVPNDVVLFSVLFDPTTSAATFGILWAQYASQSAATILRAGSFIEYLVY